MSNVLTYYDWKLSFLFTSRIMFFYSFWFCTIFEFSDVRLTTVVLFLKKTRLKTMEEHIFAREAKKYYLRHLMNGSRRSI